MPWRRSDRSDMCPGARLPRRPTPRPTIPKRLVEIDRDLHRATDLFEDGKRDEAMALLERAIARRPDTADAYISLAHAHWEAGEPRAAITTLEQALRSGAPDRDVRIRLGLYLAESGVDASRAIALLKGMPADDVEALNGLGVAYGDAGRFDEAIQVFARVLTLDPDERDRLPEPRIDVAAEGARREERDRSTERAAAGRDATPAAPSTSTPPSRTRRRRWG